MLIFYNKGNHGLACFNAYLMKKYSLITIRKGKTDPLDSIKIASYGIDYWFRLVDFEPTEKTYQELKNLNRQYLNYLSMRVKAKQAMTNLID